MIRTIVIVAFDPCDTLDVAGPLEVFTVANQVMDAQKSRRARYDVKVASFGERAVHTESGLVLTPHTTLKVASKKPIDTLIVAGGSGARLRLEEALEGAKAEALLRRATSVSRRVASVCTGAFALAKIGLFDGHRATTHWAFCDDLAKRFPKVSVCRDPIYVREGRLWSSAGVTAGIDLALALVEEDAGHAIALAVARWLVVFVRRAGGQSQFSAQLSIQSGERKPLRDLVGDIVEHPSKAHTLPDLAKRVAMSPRHFSRVFRAETGTSPAVFVERVRVEAARRLLEASSRSIDEVARAAGFGTAESLRRAFGRCLDLTPTEYRARFAQAPVSQG